MEVVSGIALMPLYLLLTASVLTENIPCQVSGQSDVTDVSSVVGVGSIGIGEKP